MKKDKVRYISPLLLTKIGKKPLGKAARQLRSAWKAAASVAGSLMATEKKLKRLRIEEELERLRKAPRLQDITFIGSSNTKKSGSLRATEKELKRLRIKEELERLRKVPRLQDITFIGSSNTKKYR